VVPLAAELLLRARRQRELLAFVEGDYEDTWAKGLLGRGRVCFGAIVLVCEAAVMGRGLWCGLIVDYCGRRRGATERVCQRRKVRLLEFCSGG
jgi:hypothetical protein